MDIRVQLPDGRVVRERKKTSASSKLAAQKWAAERHRVQRDGDTRASRPSTGSGLVTAFGSTRLDEITTEDVQRLKAALTLVKAAQSDPLALQLVLLGGEAGLRCGEMMALEWSDVDLIQKAGGRRAFMADD